MYRAVNLSRKWYAIEIDLEYDIENIDQFVSEGQMVVLFDDIEQFKNEFNIDELEIVESEGEN